MSDRRLHCVAFQGGKNAAATGSRKRLPGDARESRTPASLPSRTAGCLCGSTGPAGDTAAHSPAVKDQSNNNPLRPGRGLGVPNPQGMRQPAPAPPGTSVPCLHAQCLLPTSTDWQDRTPHGGAVIESGPPRAGKPLHGRVQRRGATPAHAQVPVCSRSLQTYGAQYH